VSDGRRSMRKPRKVYLGELMHSKSIFRILALSLLLTFNSFAQTDQARVVGIVTDSTGAVVPGASVVVKNEKTGEERTAIANQDGAFIVNALKPSVYTITVSKTDFAVA